MSVLVFSVPQTLQTVLTDADMKFGMAWPVTDARSCGVSALHSRQGHEGKGSCLGTSASWVALSSARNGGIWMTGAADMKVLLTATYHRSVKRG